MLHLGYVGAIVGTSLGSLGTATGVLCRLAREDPERYLSKLRVLLWFDIAVGCLLVAAGVLAWVGSSTHYGDDLARILFYAGTLTLAVLGGSFNEFFHKRSRVQRLVHLLLASALIFLALGAYSYSTGVSSWSRDITWGLILLIMYVAFLLVLKKSNKRVRRTS